MRLMTLLSAVVFSIGCAGKIPDKPAIDLCGLWVIKEDPAQSFAYCAPVTDDVVRSLEKEHPFVTQGKILKASNGYDLPLVELHKYLLYSPDHHLLMQNWIADLKAALKNKQNEAFEMELD